MIVLDTNVVSELMKAVPDRRVVEWVSMQATSTLYTTSVTAAEVLHGIELLSPGKRRDAILSAAQAMFETDFAGRVLPFASGAAPAYARIAAERRRKGRPISQFDAQIAAIALTERAAVATHNVADFEDCGLTIIDPWNR